MTNASFDKPSEQKVLIQSDDSSVLAAFKNKPNYQRVLTIKDTKSDAPKSVVDEIKKIADGVVVDRETIVEKNSGFFTTAFTKVVEEMHASNISVYVAPLRNEFVFLNFDYLSDPYLQLATFLSSQMVDGVITDFPATAVAYMSKFTIRDEIHIIFSTIITTILLNVVLIFTYRMQEIHVLM